MVESHAIVSSFGELSVHEGWRSTILPCSFLIVVYHGVQETGSSGALPMTQTRR